MASRVLREAVSWISVLLKFHTKVSHLSAENTYFKGAVYVIGQGKCYKQQETQTTSESGRGTPTMMDTHMQAWARGLDRTLSGAQDSPQLWHRPHPRGTVTPGTVTHY